MKKYNFDGTYYENKKHKFTTNNKTGKISLYKWNRYHGRYEIVEDITFKNIKEAEEYIQTIPEQIPEKIIKRKYINLNSKFKGCNGHHIDMEHVINIPRELHKKYFHKMSAQESMKKINWESFKFLMNQMIS